MSIKTASLRRICALAALCAPSLLCAQAKPVQTPEFAPFILDKRVERENYNFRLGPVLMDLVGTFGIEYDDNINTSETDQIEDLIFQPGISLGFKWQISEANELDVNIGAEYWYYTSNTELNDSQNQLALTPNTELSFRVLIGDVVVRVYDNLQYSFDSSDSIAVAGDGTVTKADPVSFTRFTNVAGLQSEWFIGENEFSAQLSREDVWSPDSEFEYIDRNEYKAALNVERALAANFSVGVGFAYITTDFDQEVNNDSDEFSIGPYFDWKITELIGLYAGVAWSDWQFDSLLTADDTDFANDADPNDFTGKVVLSHVVSDTFNHQVELYRAVDIGNTANFNEIDGVRYTCAYNLTPRVRLDGVIGYAENDSSGGLIEDDYERWDAGVSTALVLGPQLTAEVSYLYSDKDSDAALQSYDQNQIRLFFKYDF